MSKAPAMPLFVDAYMADTMHLTEAEDGVYMRLLMCMWRMEGRLPDDDARLSRFVRVSKGKWVKTYRPVMEDFFTIADGFWSQKRLTKEWEHVAEKVEKNRQNGAKGGRPKSLKNNDTGKANGSVSDNPDGNRSETQTESTHTHTQVEKGVANATPKKPPEADPPEPDPEDQGADLLAIPAFLDRTKAPDETLEAVASWNALAADTGLAQVQKLTDARRSKLRARLKDCGGLEGWNAALDKVRSTPGLLGQTGGTWKANFDFMLQESSFVKLMEGNYDGWTEANRRSGEPASVVQAGQRAAETLRNRDRASGGIRY